MCPEDATHNSVRFQATGHLTRPEETLKQLIFRFNFRDYTWELTTLLTFRTEAKLVMCSLRAPSDSL